MATVWPLGVEHIGVVITLAEYRDVQKGFGLKGAFPCHTHAHAHLKLQWSRMAFP